MVSLESRVTLELEVSLDLSVITVSLEDQVQVAFQADLVSQVPRERSVRQDYPVRYVAGNESQSNNNYI